ncbi:MAG: 3-isopropylmalate dehydrogenase, partial [Blautia sp.]|nr:3-isopropylmalate dehydrogenase [Blautia sp.]
DLTITLVSESYPRKLIRHLQQTQHYDIKEMEAGIYYVIGAPLPIQMIVTAKLSKEENFWLGNLTNHMKNTKDVQHLLAEYKKHKKDILYESVMDIIVKANPKMFEKEGDVMCEALEELMKDELEAQLQKGKEIGQKIGQEMGKLQGERQGETRVNQLNQKLIALGRMDDMLKSVSDTVFQQKLFKEFNL